MSGLMWEANNLREDIFSILKSKITQDHPLIPELANHIMILITESESRRQKKTMDRLTLPIVPG